MKSLFHLLWVSRVGSEPDTVQFLGIAACVCEGNERGRGRGGNMKLLLTRIQSAVDLYRIHLAVELYIVAFALNVS